MLLLEHRAAGECAAHSHDYPPAYLCCADIVLTALQDNCSQGEECGESSFGRETPHPYWHSGIGTKACQKMHVTL